MKMFMLPLVLVVIGSSSGAFLCNKGPNWASKSITERGNIASGILRGTLQSISVVNMRSTKEVIYVFQVTCIVKGLTGVAPSETISISEYLPGRCGNDYGLLSNANTGDEFLMFTMRAPGNKYNLNRVNHEEAVFPGSEAAFPCP